MIIISVLALLMVVVFIANFTLIKRKVNRELCSDVNHYYPAKWVYIYYSICFYLNLILFFAIAFISETVFPDDDRNGGFFLWVMLAVFFVLQIYYVIFMHVEHYYFSFGEDYIDYFFGLKTKGTDTPVRINLADIASVESTRYRYVIRLIDGKKYSILKFQLNMLEGYENISQKLELLKH